MFAHCKTFDLSFRQTEWCGATVERSLAPVAAARHDYPTVGQHPQVPLQYPSR